MAANQRKTTDATVSGRVVRADVKIRKPFRKNYYLQASQDEIFADCAIELETGETVYFKSPAIARSVSNAIGCAVVCHHPKENGFFTEIGENCVSLPGKPNDNRMECNIHPGQTITITGRIKTETVSRAGKPYKVLTHCKLVPTA